MKGKKPAIMTKKNCEHDWVEAVCVKPRWKVLNHEKNWLFEDPDVTSCAGCTLQNILDNDYRITKSQCSNDDSRENVAPCHEDCIPIRDEFSMKKLLKDITMS